MKLEKYLVPFLVCIFLLTFCACSGGQKKNVEKAITSELDLLKNLDTETTQKYISYTEIFPDAIEETELPENIQSVFSLFFQNFDYKILKIDVDTKANKAAAQLRLKTPDAVTLAKDYAHALLKHEILSAAGSESDHGNDELSSLKARFLLLNQLLSDNTYKAIDTDCTIQLTRANNASDVWEIKRTTALENNLVGGLMTALAENDLISPEETLNLYLDTLEEMNLNQMSNYFGLSSLLNSDDLQKQAIADALVEQVHEFFKYEISGSKVIDSYTAEVQARITSFDSESILSSYQEEIDAYLSTTQAVIDGSAARTKKAYDMLLKYIEESTTTMEHEVTFQLFNDGISWKLTNASEALGNAIFGPLAASPVEES